MCAKKSGMIALRQVGNMRQQQRGGHIQPDFGNAGRGVDDKAVGIEPNDDIA